MEQKICCVILAAGSSKRMGEEKALVRLNGESLISWISKRLVKIGLNPVIVTKKEIAYRFVVNPIDPEGLNGGPFILGTDNGIIIK